MEKLIPLDLPPGMRNTGTVYQSKDHWYTGNLVRFFDGTIQPIGGWAARSLSGATIAGVPRTMVTYRINSGVQIIVIGTSTGVFSISGSVVTDITPAGLAVSAGRVWQFDVFGTWLIAVDLLAGGVAGAAYYWDGDTGTDLVQLGPWDGSDPTRLLSIVGTPERYMVGLGGIRTASGYVALGKQANSRRVVWANQEGGFVTGDWDETDTTMTAGYFELTTDGSLRCGRRSRGLTLLWTTTDLWSMTYIGGEFIYRFDQVANACGIISSHAAVVTNMGAYWMGENGFFHYEGVVTPIPCDVQDYVFNSFNRTYAHLVWALENPTFSEVTWFYPHAAQTEITRYVTYNYREHHWSTGTLARTCGVSQQPGTHSFPVMTNASGVVYNHESGMVRYGEGTASLESGPLEIAEGDRLVSLLRVVPDDDTVGDVNLTVYTAPNPDTAETTNGPYTLTASTSVRLKARQIRLKLAEVSATDEAWTQRVSPTTHHWIAVAWSPSLSLFAAIDSNLVAGTNAVTSSPDGATWTARSAGTANHRWADLIWATELGLFIGVSGASGETTNAITSANGTTWTARTATDSTWACVGWNGTTAVAAGAAGAIMTSTNGTAWTDQVSTGLDGNGLLDIAWSSTLSLWVGVTGLTDAAQQIYTSANGIAWTARTGATDVAPSRVIWSSDLAMFVATAYGGGEAGVYTSTNGTTWTFAAFDAGSVTTPLALAWSDELDLLVVLDYGTAAFVTSTDGLTWTAGSGGIANSWSAVAFAPSLSMFAAVSLEGTGTNDIATWQVVPNEWRVGTIRLGVQESSRR